jgi:hypothetical protein
VPLPELAGESVRRIQGAAESVAVVSQREVGSESAPALTQRLTFSVVPGGLRRDLIQSQVFLSLLDAGHPGEQVVIRSYSTSTAAQHGAVLQDLQEFVRTVRPDGTVGGQTVTGG